MDLKQPLGQKAGKAKAKKAAYPTKTTINLVNADAARGNLLMEVLLFIVVIALIAIFAKFAVADPLARSFGSNAEVAQAQTELDSLEAENADYAKLNEKYERYVVTGLTEKEANLADRSDIVEILSKKVMSVGHVSSLKLVDNTITITCLGIDLAEVSRLVESLESESLVAYVTVSTAQGETDAAASATLEITFNGALDDVEDAGSDTAKGTEAGK